MRLLQPIENFLWERNISQLFAVNYKLYYDKFRMQGHNGLDYVFPNDPDKGYGRPIRACHSGKVIRVVFDDSMKSQGTAVYLESTDGKTRTTYMHLSDARVRLGAIVNAWDVIGLAGNSGFVFPKPSKYWPHAGTHLHLLVQRLVNGRWIAVDPTPLLFNTGDKLPLKFTKTLGLGSTGDQVSWLQTCLKLEGFAKDYEPISYFGRKTLRDVRKLQVKQGWTPALGVGPKTRSYLNKKYSL